MAWLDMACKGSEPDVSLSDLAGYRPPAGWRVNRTQTDAPWRGRFDCAGGAEREGAKLAREFG